MSWKAFYSVLMLSVVVILLSMLLLSLLLLLLLLSSLSLLLLMSVREQGRVFTAACAWRCGGGAAGQSHM